MSFTGPTFDFSGESKFNTLGDKLVASAFYENDLLFFSLNHGILKTKDNSLRLNIEDDIFMKNVASTSETLNYSNFANNTLGNISLLGGNEMSNTTLQGGDEYSFSRAAKPHSFDMTFTNLNVNDQSLLVRFKEAFQLFLRKDEVKQAVSFIS